VKLDDQTIADAAGWPGPKLEARARAGDALPKPLAPQALYGVAGEIVQTIEPHTEADPAGVLLQLLAAWGNLVGRTPHFIVEGDKHHTNINLVLVGATSKGRKGSSWSQVRRFVRAVDERWETTRIVSGLSSGEGLIFAVKDADAEAEESTDAAEPGDRRLFVVETELGGTMKILNRQGNNLSAVVRQAWDTGNLATLTKNSPLRATDAHISIVGHVTREEVRRHLLETELANGFANRFLWVCVRRSKLLPDGGRIHEVDTSALVHQLVKAVSFARKTSLVQRDEEAKALWHEAYSELSAERAGLLGAVSNRAEAQVMRLALIYALLDHSCLIRRPHLEAALALWDYCEASAAHIFGTALGDPTADAILGMLETSRAGLTRTQIRDGFGRNKSGDEIDRALSVLQRDGRAGSRAVSTGGRPAEHWYAVTTKTSDTTKARGDAQLPSYPSFPSYSAKGRG